MAGPRTSAPAAERRITEEEQLAFANSPGWRSFDQLEAALAELDPPEELIERDGLFFREVPYHIGEDGTYELNGELVQEVYWSERRVALSRRECLDAMTEIPPREVDFFDGVTWWRRGQKPEKNIGLAAIQGPRQTDRKTLRPVRAHDRAQIEKLTRVKEAAAPVTVVKEA